MTTPLLLLDALIRGLDARKNGKGWMARCPVHGGAGGDSDPSLSIDVGKDGRPLVHCFGGCEQKDVVDHLRDMGLWPESAFASGAREKSGNIGNHGNRVTAQVRKGQNRLPAAPQSGNHGNRGGNQTAPAVLRETLYEYRDATGRLLATHKRLDLDNGKKRLSWLGPDGAASDGQTKTPDLPLYRLADVLAAPNAWVLCCEGEKAADAACALGFTATTLGGGAAQREFGAALTPLQGRRVALLPDNDVAGRQLMLRVAASLRTVAAEVRWLELPGLPDKGDVYDYREAGGTADALRRLVEDAPTAAQHAASALRVMSAAELLAKELPEMRQIVPGLLYEGAMLLAGRPKLGKSWLALGACLSVAYGGRALGRVQVEGGDVLYLALEDGPKRLQSRLRDLLGEQPPPARLTLATEWKRLDEGGLEELEVWLAAHPNASLVAIDTLKRIRPRELGRKALYDVDYDAVAPLNDLAHTYGVCIVIVHHTRKMDAEDPMDLISGTLGLTGAVDGAIVLKRTRGSMDATLVVVGRDGEDAELALRWDDETAGWVLLGDAEEHRRSTERNSVLRLLHDAPESQTIREVADLLERPYASTKKLLWAMAKDGEVKATGGRYVALVVRPQEDPVNIDELRRRREERKKSATTGNHGNRGNSGNLGDQGNRETGVETAGAGVETPPENSCEPSQERLPRLPAVTGTGNRDEEALPDTESPDGYPVTVVTDVSTESADGDSDTEVRDL